MYKVGKIESRLDVDCIGLSPHKFVVARAGEDVEFYAVQSRKDSPSHQWIAKHFGLKDSDVVGGGYVRREEQEKIDLYGNSQIFGPVRIDIIENLAGPVLEAYQIIDPTIREISYDSISDEWNRIQKGERK